ncbi:MAG: hypothetical protein K8W52_24450 [Deltaproteobacteria bacterium]|nr:hypothetical protein [Deltaproteobacteria bacterium]
MGDRQDIDALLIGALYGELEGADQARLDAHLAAHPSDRAAMDALVQTRATLRDRIAALPDFDPAPKLSTLLLQEAAKRARPVAAESGGLLAWLRNMFRPIVAHPALATAMTVAVIGGAAGLLYKSGRGEVTTDTAHSSEMAAAPTRSAEQSSAPTALARPPGEGKSQSTNGDFQVGLLEGQGAKDQAEARVAKPADTGVAEIRGQERTATIDREQALKKEAPSTGKGRGYVAVTTPEPEVKHLEDENVAQQRYYAGDTAPGRSGAAAPGAGAAPALAPAADPTAPAVAFDQDKANALDAWAKVQHAHLTKLVQAGKCKEAGALGSDIAAKAPEYFIAHVDNDRAVRACKQYIDSEKRRRASETAKSRARNVDEELAQPLGN